jgi:hypothetical protein
VVLEDPDWRNWHFNPPAPALERLITLVCESFRRWGDAEAGRKHVQLFRAVPAPAAVTHCCFTPPLLGAASDAPNQTL